MGRSEGAQTNGGADEKEDFSLKMDRRRGDT